MHPLAARVPAVMVAALDEARGDRSRGEVVREALARWLNLIIHQRLVVGGF